ncbi:hypothetical protein FPZ49_01795 [Paenibacillus cremeus]|uniref:Uncharacterized protein n=1 Tax=Paenibacillus cremeus TaxID=2163881 RepID=A0A559KH70_9BACL|nr:hypothetical protein FPZ49_01795 [Paenibacillus cremeus]
MRILSWAARKGASKVDAAYTACSFRAVTCLSQVLFALNGQYWMNEKGSVKLIASFPLAPDRFESRVNEAFAKLCAASHTLLQAVEILERHRRRHPCGSIRPAEIVSFY